MPLNQAKEALVVLLRLRHRSNFIFYQHSTTAQIELQSARYLNPENRLLLNFLKIKEPKNTNSAPNKQAF